MLQFTQNPSKSIYKNPNQKILDTLNDPLPAAKVNSGIDLSGIGSKTAAQSAAEQVEKERKIREAFYDTIFPGPSQTDLEYGKAKHSADTAQAAYENYMKSQERAKKAEEVRKQNDQIAFSSGGSIIPGYGIPGIGMPFEDEKEMELKAKADYYKNQQKAIADQRIMKTDIEFISAMTQEDRSALERYAVNRYRDLNAPVELTSSPFYLTAEQEASSLIAKYGKQKVDELAESYMRQKGQIASANIRNAAQKGAGSGTMGAIGHSAGSVFANAVGTLIGAPGLLQSAATSTGRYQTMDPNNPGSLPGQYAGAVRQTVAENIEKDNGLLGKVGSTVYQAGMSAADNLVRIAMGGGTTFGTLSLAAVGSFGQSVNQASSQGAAPAQAVLKGVADAFIEVGTEYLPLENLFKAGKSGAVSAGKAIKEALKQAGIEATTEEISYLGSLAADAAILQSKSGYNQQIGELVANGMSYEDAKKQANAQLWNEAVDTFTTSFLSGGMMSGAQSGANYLAQMQQDNARYKAELSRDIQAMMQRDAARNETQNATVPENATVSKPETVPQVSDLPQQQKERAMRDILTQTTETDKSQTKGQQPSMDGSVFELQDANKAGPTMAGESPENGSLATPKGPASDNIISEADSNVNGQNQPNEAAKDFEAMGAASTGFSPFSRMQFEYGNIPEGENPVRSDDMPRSTDGTDRVSYTARTAKGAQVTPDEFVPLIENEVVRGGFSFIPITNDQTVQNAVQNIQDEGWRTARANWTAQVRQGRTGADITATGALLYNHAVNSGEYQEAMDILIDYQLSVRNAAQAVQAARILKTLTPESRLYMIRRSIQRMVQDMNLNREITIDENLARRYQETRDDAEADRILDEIAQDVARQIPPTLGERITALRYLNMLGNLRTQVRNISGNLGAKATYFVKDKIAAAIEWMASVASGGRFQRTKVNVVDRATRNAARADYDNVADWISGGGRTNDSGTESDDFARRVQEHRRILPVGLEQYRRVTDWAMNNEYFGDAAFGREAYARALAGYLNARGIRTDNLNAVDRNTMNRAREYAVRQAQEATFRDNNQVSTFVSGLLRGRNTPAWARVIGEAVMPFRKTPANVLVRAEQFSPLGLINSAVNTVRAARGDISGADLVESWAKTLTGTGLFAIGWALANMGYLRGGPDDDEDKAAFDELNGYQDYALVLPDGTNLTIDFLSPAAMPILLGAQFDKIANGTDLTWADLEGVFSTLSDPMIEMSMLQGVNDTIDAIRYADNSMGQFLANAMTNYLTQALGNTLLGQMERSTEESRMTTYIDKDSSMPAWIQRNLGKLSQKIPGWDFNQTAYIDQWGREQQNPKGIANWLYQLFSPSYIDKANVDEIANELYRLNEAQSDVNVFPKSPEATLTYTDKDGNRHENYNLTAEELDKLKRTEGKTQADLVSGLVQSKDYKALTDTQKAKALGMVYDYARELARVETISDYKGFSESWMENAKGNETAFIIQKVAGADISDAMNAVSKSWREGYDDTKARAALESAFEQYGSLSEEAQASIGEDASGRMEAYLNARKQGIETDTFVDLYKGFWDIDQKDVSQNEKAQQWARTLEKAYESGTITEKQKNQLKNDMVFYQNFPAETEKFDQLTEAGISADDAYDLGWLLNGITGTGAVDKETGKAHVRDVDKWESIADADFLSESEIDTAIKIYMPDYDPEDESPDKTELKYDYARQEWGLSAAEYAAIYRVQADGDNKEEKVAGWKALGYSDKECELLWNLFGSSGKNKIDVVSWYEQQQ